MWWTNTSGVRKHLAKLLGRDECEIEATFDVKSMIMRVTTSSHTKPFTDEEKQTIYNSFGLWMVSAVYNVEVL